MKKFIVFTVLCAIGMPSAFVLAHAGGDAIQRRRAAARQRAAADQAEAKRRAFQRAVEEQEREWARRRQLERDHVRKAVEQFRAGKLIFGPQAQGAQCVPVLDDGSADLYDYNGDALLRYTVWWDCDGAATGKPCSITITCSITWEGEDWPNDETVWCRSYGPATCQTTNIQTIGNFDIGTLLSMPTGSYQATFLVWANASCPFDPNNLPACIGGWNTDFEIGE